jgi:hypothetical protein
MPERNSMPEQNCEREHVDKRTSSERSDTLPIQNLFWGEILEF